MDIDKTVSNLTLEEKCSLVVGKNGWETMNIDRLGIPAIFMADGPHGIRKVKQGTTLSEQSITAVCYPSLVTLASSFNPKISFKMGAAIASEFRANDVSLLLGPGINIKRHPFCGRNFEYFSEDPVVTTEMAKGFLEGIKSQEIGVCLKHYALNSQESYRMISNSIVDERAKYEIYYKSFKNLIDLDPEMVMCSYNKVDGTYASENVNLLKEVLRDEFGFNNVIVSDWSAVNNRTKALIATLDLEMPGSGYGLETIINDVKNGTLPLNILDDSVKRILNLVNKFKNQERIPVDLETNHLVARDIATESFVLLKNKDNILPINKKEKILLLGEMADKVRYQGGGSSHINSYKVSSILKSLNKYDNIDYLKGYNSNESDHDTELLSEAAKAAKAYDKIIIVCGLTDEYESEGYDRIHLSIPKNQEYLINKISLINENIILLLQIGSPIVMPYLDKVKGIINCYLGGEAIGEAVEKIIFGEVNPSGRLAETFPLKASDIAANDNFAKGNNNVYYQESIYVGYRYYHSANLEVLFPFGYGKSYSHFEYSNITCNKVLIKNEKEVIKASVNITNKGPYDGKEVILLFFEPKSPKTPRPKRELIGFEKVFIKNGETKKVTFSVKSSNLEYYNPSISGFTTDDGIYNLQICRNSRDILVDIPIEVKCNKERTPSIWDDLNSYDSKKGLTFTKVDYEKLIGATLEPNNIKQTRPFDINNNIEDIESTFFGGILKKSIMKKVDALMVDAPDDFRLMVLKGITQQPLRSLALLSQGKVKVYTMKTIIALINRQYFKAIKYLFKKV